MTDTNKKFNQNLRNKWCNISENIILKNESQKNKEKYMNFIENYAKENCKGFPGLCCYIMKNDIKSLTIANFVNGGARLKFSNEKDRDTFISIAKQIGQLIVNQEIELDSFKPQELANTFNGLAKCGVNLGEYLNKSEKKTSKDVFIGALVGKIKNLLKEFNSIDIANTFNGLAKCGVNLCGCVNDEFIGALVGRIKDLLNETNFKKQFNSIGIANTFNGLAKCGVNLGGYLNKLENKALKDAFIEALLGKIQTLLEQKQFTSQHIANTFNGLAKCGVNLGGYFKTKEGEKNAFIGALVGEIQNLLEDFNSIGIANTFNGLGQCGINLGEYLNKLENKALKDAFIGALLGKIQTLLKEFNSIGIANTFNGLAKCGINLDRYFETEEGKDSKNAFIEALVGRIKDLLEDFNSIDIANTFNGLAKCGVNLGEYVNNDFIRALVNKIQVLLNKKDSQIGFNFKPQELANTFNGLAKCGVNLGEYINGTFIEALVGRIKDLLEDFNSIDIANTFNGLAKCGINLGEYIDGTFIEALVGGIQTLLGQEQFTSQELANTSNGLVSLFLYNKDLYEKNISQFKDIINDLVQKYFEQLKYFEQSNRDNRSNWAMLYNIKYLQVYSFNDVILSEIETNLKSNYLNDVHTLKLDALNNDHTNSALEGNFETFLSNTLKIEKKTTEIFETKDGYYESQSKLTFLVTSHVSFERLIDFYIEFIQDNKTYKAYIELDGPTHFTDTEQTRKTPQTQIRDILTLKQLQEEQAKADDNTQILYVTLSAKKFDEIKKSIKTKKDLLDFLTEKNQLKQITEKTSDNSKMAVEYKSIYDSVNDVASKTMDIDDYTTPTPGQAVSELAQKAQQDDGWITVKSNYKGKPKDKKQKQKQNQERY